MDAIAPGDRIDRALGSSAAKGLLLACGTGAMDFDIDGGTSKIGDETYTFSGVELEIT